MSLSRESRDIFARLRLVLGEEGLEKLRSATVAVVGLGAVGSFALEALARSGVGRLRLVDFDSVQPTNINRQLLALTSTLGRPKVEVAKERVLQINPSLEVETLPLFFDDSVADQVLGPPLSYVVDAIDALGPKVTLMYEAHGRGIPCISALGAANRTDPSQVRVSDISKTEGCPLARRVRRRLRRLGMASGATVVWSSEVTQFGPVSEGDGDQPEEEPTLQRGRKRGTQPSLCALPGIFGLVCANHVIWSLVGKPVKPGL